MPSLKCTNLFCFFLIVNSFEKTLNPGASMHPPNTYISGQAASNTA